MATCECWRGLTQHDFIQHQNIVYLNQKHKKGSYRLYNNNAIYVQYWALQHLEDVFFSRSWWSQWGSNPIHIKHPNTKSMPIHAFMWPQWCYINGCHICTNNMKSHFFTLMGFDVHHTIVPLIWIIMSQQTVENLVEWFKPLNARMLSPGQLEISLFYYWQCFIRI